MKLSKNREKSSICCGVKLYSQDFFNSIEDRIWLSSGTQTVSTANGYKFHNCAYIPKTPWRRPTSEEISKLLSNQYPHTNNLPEHIVIFPFPLNIYSELNRALHIKCKMEGIEKIQLLSDNKKLIQETDLRLEVNIFNKYIVNNFLLPNSRLVEEAIYLSRKCISSSWYEKNKSLVGLHVDDWDGGSIEQRRTISLPKIALNLGNSQRYLLFINISLVDIYKKLNAQGLKTTGNCNSLIKLFLKTFPEYPVVKIAIQPGEAYSLFADYIIHDGYPINMKSFDFHIHVRGQFSFQKCSINT